MLAVHSESYSLGSTDEETFGDLSEEEDGSVTSLIEEASFELLYVEGVQSSLMVLTENTT